jgi:hypothetical protein
MDTLLPEDLKREIGMYIHKEKYKDVMVELISETKPIFTINQPTQIGYIQIPTWAISTFVDDEFYWLLYDTRIDQWPHRYPLAISGIGFDKLKYVMWKIDHRNELHYDTWHDGLYSCLSKDVELLFDRPRYFRTQARVLYARHLKLEHSFYIHKRKFTHVLKELEYSIRLIKRYRYRNSFPLYVHRIKFTNVLSDLITATTIIQQYYDSYIADWEEQKYCINPCVMFENKGQYWALGKREFMTQNIARESYDTVIGRSIPQLKHVLKQITQDSSVMEEIPEIKQDIWELPHDTVKNGISQVFYSSGI